MKIHRIKWIDALAQAEYPVYEALCSDCGKPFERWDAEPECKAEDAPEAGAA